MVNMSNVNSYNRYLDDYRKMIFNEKWWDGRREKLVALMDKLWNKMNESERDLALEYSAALYQKRIGI